MKHKLKKDYSKRQNFKQLELHRLKLRMIKNNKILSMKERLEANNKLDCLTGQKTKVRNRCIITGRSRGVLKK